MTKKIDALVEALELVKHATTPEPDDGSGHEVAHEIATRALNEYRKGAWVFNQEGLLAEMVLKLYETWEKSKLDDIYVANRLVLCVQVARRIQGNAAISQEFLQQTEPTGCAQKRQKPGNEQAMQMGFTKLDMKALRQLAQAATPLDFDSAEMKRNVGETVECPHCQGEGNVTLEADYCNFDGTAIGVEFYGIGEAHGAAEAFVRAFNPKTAIQLIERIEAAEADLQNSREREKAATQLAFMTADAGQEGQDALQRRIEELEAENVMLKSAAAKNQGL